MIYKNHKAIAEQACFMGDNKNIFINTLFCLKYLKKNYDVQTK